MIDLSRPHRFHVVGAGGAGMSAIATVLAAMGHQVSGSDLKDSPGLRRLEAAGVKVFVGHQASNVGDAELVAASTAVNVRNPELAAARAAGIEVLSRAQILAAICATRRTLSVSGTHGKTTTSSMLAMVLVEAGLQPGFIVGGELNEVGGGAAWSDGDLFVVEADESDGTFVELPSAGVIVTNVEADHLDHYGDLAHIEAAFERFLHQAPGPNVVCADDPGAARLGRAAGALLYGTAAEADYRITEVVAERSAARAVLVRDGDALGELRLPIPGLHNLRNATAATALAMEFGASFTAAQRALARYAGVARRFQHKGVRRGVTVVDDYAHNPGKVAALLEAASSSGWDRVVVVFQPHRFSRTAALGRELGEALAAADVAVVMDVYAAGEAPMPGVSGRTVLDALRAAAPEVEAVWAPRRDDVLAYLRGALTEGDLCLTVGAGDVTSLGPDILELLAP